MKVSEVSVVPISVPLSTPCRMGHGVMLGRKVRVPFLVGKIQGSLNGTSFLQDGSATTVHPSSTSPPSGKKE